MLDLHGISPEAFDLIVAEEVTSREFYEARYRHALEHPSDNSGPTGGIGYDCGTQSRAQILADWSTDEISEATRKILAGAAGLRGDQAEAYCRKTRGLIDIPFDVAMGVFAGRNVPQYAAIMRRYLPGVDELSPHCQGALLSITFNRDASGFAKSGPRYVEMRGIRDAIRSGELERIPALIRSMKRLWPPTSGLVKRREREAVLFEKGLAEQHPQALAASAAVEVPDPDLVIQVQQQLRNLGYYQVGAVDGSAPPKGKLEDAILAFRNKNGLPLTPKIDDELLVALSRARPPEVAEERSRATAEDLRAQKSETIEFTDKVKAWGGKLFGSGGVLGGGGALVLATEKATEAKNASDAIGALGLSTEAWLLIGGAIVLLAVLAGAGVAIWYVAHRIEQKRLADYRTGKNP